MITFERSSRTGKPSSLGMHRRGYSYEENPGVTSTQAKQAGSGRAGCWAAAGRGEGRGAGARPSAMTVGRSPGRISGQRERAAEPRVGLAERELCVTRIVSSPEAEDGLDGVNRSLRSEWKERAREGPAEPRRRGGQGERKDHGAVACGTTGRNSPRTNQLEMPPADALGPQAQEELGWGVRVHAARRMLQQSEQRKARAPNHSPGQRRASGVSQHDEPTEGRKTSRHGGQRTSGKDKHSKGGKGRLWTRKHRSSSPPSITHSHVITHKLPRPSKPDFSAFSRSCLPSMLG